MTGSFGAALTLFMGIVLGTFFYGGLWWTVQKVAASKRPGVLLVGSFITRAAIVLGAFLLVAQGGWRGVLACFLGFLVARVAVTLLTRTSLDAESHFRETSP